jgi:hypothetical protein
MNNYYDLCSYSITNGIGRILSSVLFYDFLGNNSLRKKKLYTLFYLIVCQKGNPHEDKSVSSLSDTPRRRTLLLYPRVTYNNLFVCFLQFRFFIKNNKLIIYYDSLQLSDVWCSYQETYILWLMYSYNRYIL